MTEPSINTKTLMQLLQLRGAEILRLRIENATLRKIVEECAPHRLKEVYND